MIRWIISQFGKWVDDFVTKSKVDNFVMKNILIY